MPAGQLLSGTTFFSFPFKVPLKPGPSDTVFGAGDRGFENGCAIPVDVAAGVPSVRGDLVAEGSNWGREEVNERMKDAGEGRTAREERKQRAQIMMVVCGGGKGGWGALVSHAS